MTTQQFEVRNRWTNAVQFTATIEVTPGMTTRVKLGLAVKWGRANNADLRGANLSGAYLSDAYLSDADLRDANLSGAPIIPNIHQQVYAAASQPGALNMRDWHTCDTTHCRAGWVVALAGEEGKALEDRIGTPAAASLIYLASDPDLGKFPSFYCDDATALADMKERAEQEAAKAGAA